MGLSLGWLLFLGGILGAVRILRAKTFSWANEVDTVVTEEDRKREGPMTPSKRWILITICLLLAVVGAILIQKQHNWNPLHRDVPSEHTKVTTDAKPLAPNG